MEKPSAFRPAGFLPGPDLMTVFGPVFRPPPRLPLRRERWELSDGDFVDLDWLDGASGKAGSPLVVVLHGLEGSSSAHYVRGLLREASRRALRGVALNFRSCSGEPNRLLRSYHSGETRDFGEVMERLVTCAPRLGVVGCSLGGNVLVKWLGEQGEGAPSALRAAVALSVPFDLALCADTLDGPGLMRWVYRTRFLRTLRRKSLEKLALFPGGFDRERLLRARTLREFDEAVTAPVHGFAGANDYYAQSSSGPFVARVRVPLLLVSAEDDPFIPARSIPRREAAENPFVLLETPARGGHLGFIEGPPWAPRFWAEGRALDFLSQRLA